MRRRKSANCMIRERKRIVEKGRKGITEKRRNEIESKADGIKRRGVARKGGSVI